MGGGYFEWFMLCFFLGGGGGFLYLKRCVLCVGLSWFFYIFKSN